MGPHPEAPVDIQKYIGSCLITQQPRTKRKSCPRGHPSDGGATRGGGYLPPCNRCCSAPIQTPGYNISNYAWTGVPLISVGSRQGKIHHLPVHSNKNSRIYARNNTSLEYSIAPGPDLSECNNLEEILPISRLAIHAQGAPLILSPKDKDKDSDSYSVPVASFKSREFYLSDSPTANNRVYMLMSAGNDDVHSQISRSSCYIEEDVADFGLNPPRTVSSSPSQQSDCTSTTSEDSVISENGLPRIIKPRKRRKKDRRTSESDCGSVGAGMEELPGTIVTLKPYQPLCYRYDNNGTRVYPSPPTSPEVSSSTIEWRRKKGLYPYAPSSRCRCPYCVPPPSTFLTPPDSPVDVSEDGLVAVIRKNRGRIIKRGFNNFLAIDNGDEDSSAEETIGKNQNTVILPSSQPPERPWIKMIPDDSQFQPHCLFTVMCYNILCDKYATRQMYGYCPNWALDWSYRKKIILQEIIHYKADIISLQEVETDQFYKYFLPELQNEGYDGIFSPKSRAKTMACESERKLVDGCAIFYKTDKFTLVREHLMEFNQLAMANAEGCEDMFNRVMPKDNIGLAALLQTKPGAYQNKMSHQTNQHILVCTAHIHWDPEFSDVKLVQMMMLMHELNTFVDDILKNSSISHSQKSDPNLIPLLLCGDFNSLPESGVIEYLSKGRVSTRHGDFKEYVYNDCLNKLGNTTKTNEFTHPFQISRAYKDDIMPFTNYSQDFKGVIDYVFYSKLHMSVCGVLGPIDTEWLKENKVQGCPHPNVPSDHFPIVVELHLNPTVPIKLSAPNGIVPLHR